MKKEKITFIILRTIGNFFVLFSLFGMAGTFGPAFYLEIIYRYNVIRNVRFVASTTTAVTSASFQLPQPLVATPTVPIPAFDSPTVMPVSPTVMVTPTPTITSTFFGALADGDRVEVLSPVSTTFGIIVPKIGANAPIISNVDASNSKAYLAALKKGVAHAAGTVFPGMNGRIYLFAHSTDAFWNVGRYNAIFYLLKELGEGDEIDIFYNGVRHVYRVTQRKVVDPSETDFISKQTPHEELVLQTCWPPGTTFKRILIIARPERDISTE